MNSIAFRFVVLWGWRRALVAVICGGLSALAQAPYNLYPVLFLTFPILIWLMDGASKKKNRTKGQKRQEFWSAFKIGWYFGFGYFLVGLYWIGAAFLVEADTFAWMMPFAVILLPIGLAIFTGLSCAVANLLWTPGFLRIITFATTWAAFEWLRGTVLTGFPWNTVGYGFAANEAIAQSTSIFGIYALSLLTVMIASSPAALAEGELTARKSLQNRLAGPLAMLVLYLGLWGYGVFRISTSEASFVSGVSLRIVQPNIKQSEKWKPENASKIFSRYLELSDIATSPQTMGISDATHIIWPESALPFLLEERQDALSAIAALLPDTATLITGAIRRTQIQGQKSKYYNSVFTLNGKGNITGRYDKFHLVPFGESLPFEELLSKLGIRKFVTLPGTFARGPGPVSMAVNGAPAMSPLICYEAIFPGRVTADDSRPGWIVNVTNDGWFGNTAGPYQHLQQVRIRAIEEGLPVIRAANTGISAIIDPYGRILQQLALNRSGVIDGALPSALEPTFFSKWGNKTFFLMILFSFLSQFVWQWLQKRSQ